MMALYATVYFASQDMHRASVIASSALAHSFMTAVKLPTGKAMDLRD